MGKRIQKLQMKNIGSRTIDLGFVGENIHTHIVIDCGEVLRDYPDATVTMQARPPGGDMYEPETVVDGSRVVWEVQANDVESPGEGRYQLKFVSGNEIIKSAVGSYSVRRSLRVTSNEGR